MSGEAVRLRVVPAIGARIPGFVAHIVFAVVAIALCVERFEPGFWLIVSLVLIALAVVVPQRLTAWALIVVLGASQALGELSLDGRFLVLLAGVHFVHVLAAQMLVLPVRSWVQLAVFRRPLLRFLAIQVLVQTLAVLASLFLGPGGGIALPVFAIVGAVALVWMTGMLIAPLLRERAR